MVDFIERQHGGEISFVKGYDGERLLCLIDLEKEMCFFVAGGIASAEATKGLSDRPLETFGRH
ncbi:MAG: hypothetical protein MRZ51_11070 [Faecalibacterium sp.]|nr:hypothetical protein [Faecalibacterium sp.]